jgi:repressor LexA
MSDPSSPASDLALTARQQQVLDCVQRYIEQSGAPPTRAEIAAELGFRSINSAEEHLQALARKGAIELVAGTSRGIRLKTLRRRRPRRAETAAATQLPFVAPPDPRLSLPLLGRVAAGSPLLAQEHIEQYFQVDVSLFDRKADYLLRVRGMSMRDVGIFDGDLLAVHKTAEARAGQIIVARLGDDVTVKRLHKQGGRITLLPENPDFEPIEVNPSDSFCIEGLAVGLIRQGGWN